MKLAENATILKNYLSERAVSREFAIDAVLVLARQIKSFHDRGIFHGMVTASHIYVDEAGFPSVAVVSQESGPVKIGGAAALPETAPPILKKGKPLLLPHDISAATRILAQNDILISPQQIDIYQLGAVFCRMFCDTGVYGYMLSIKAKSKIADKDRQILESMLGLVSRDSYVTCDEVIAGLDALRSGGIQLELNREDEVLPVSVFISPDSPEESESKPVNTQHVEKLGHYEIVEKIGHGGMGDVYKAYEPALGRYVALKVLPDELARQEQFIARFKAEAEAAAKLNHPNIVSIFFISQDQGKHYFSMQYIDGESLGQLIHRRGRLTPAEVVAIMRQCLQGLEAAHAKGIIHRDMKPGNILLDKKTHAAVITDFGLVKLIDASTQITMTGTIMGTAEYVSPEQARGLQLDARSDLYSLGVTFYEALTGKRLFEADSPAALMHKHAYDEPTPMHHEFPEIPFELCMIISRLLKKEPGKRYQNAAEVFEELGKLKFPNQNMIGNVHPVISLDDHAITNLLCDDDFVFEKHNLWQRAKNYMVDILGLHGKATRDSLELSFISINRHIEAQEKGCNELEVLLAEAGDLIDDLQSQIAGYQDAADEIQNSLDREPDSEKAIELTCNKQAQLDVIHDIEQLIAEQHQNIDRIQVAYDTEHARLLEMGSTRDAIVARMLAAGMQIPGNDRRSWMKPVRLALITAISVLALVIISGFLLRRHEVVSTVSAAGQSEYAFVTPDNNWELSKLNSMINVFDEWAVKSESWYQVRDIIRGTGAHLGILEFNHELPSDFIMNYKIRMIAGDMAGISFNGNDNFSIEMADQFFKVRGKQVISCINAPAIAKSVKKGQIYVMKVVFLGKYYEIYCDGKLLCYGEREISKGYRLNCEIGRGGYYSTAEFFDFNFGYAPNKILAAK